MMKVITLVLLAPLMTGRGFGQSQTVSSNGSFEIRPTNLPVVVGLFERADRNNGRLYVALDKERRQLEEVEIGKIRAVFLLQGNRKRLLNYLVGGGASGGTLGLAGLFIVDKALVNKTPTSPDRNDIIWWSSAGASAGLLVGFLLGRGEEDVRAWPVYSLEFVSTISNHPGKRDLRNQENIYRIPAGAIIQVVMGLPE